MKKHLILFLTLINLSYICNVKAADTDNNEQITPTILSSDLKKEYIDNSDLIRNNNSSSIYLVYDLSNDKIMESLNANKLHPIASLTKLMTAYTFLKYYPYSLYNCNTAITKEDKNITNTRLSKNKLYSCEDIVRVMLTVSDNYAASALARSIPGFSKQDFFNKMNEEAYHLNMLHTKYVDSSGLMKTNQSTALDLLNLVKELLQYSKIKELASTKETFVNNVEFKNSNKIVRDEIYDTDLSKTGHINESGYNLIFVPKYACEDKKIAIILMGATSSEDRFNTTKKLLQKYNC